MQNNMDRKSTIFINLFDNNEVIIKKKTIAKPRGKHQTSIFNFLPQLIQS